MITTETLRYELDGRLAALDADLGKRYISVRWEPGPKIVRVGACIGEFTWDNRMKTIRALLDFERAHADEFAVDFDVIPHSSVVDDAFAEVRWAREPFTEHERSTTSRLLSTWPATTTTSIGPSSRSSTPLTSGCTRHCRESLTS